MLSRNSKKRFHRSSSLRRDWNHELYPSHPTVINQSAHGSLLLDHFDSLHVMQPNDPAAIIQRLCSIFYEPAAIELNHVAKKVDPVATEYDHAAKAIHELFFINKD